MRELDTAGITLFFLLWIPLVSSRTDSLPCCIRVVLPFFSRTFLLSLAVLVFPRLTGVLQWIVRGRAGGGEAVPHRGVLSYGC